MFDFGWTEGLLLAALAIIVVGPKDLPGLARTAGSLIQKGRRMYRDTVSGLYRLEREIDIAERPINIDDRDERALLPDEVRAAMTMESPHGNAESHRRAETARQKAIADRDNQQNKARAGSAAGGEDRTGE